jgi:hypothetical protein
MLHEGGTAMCLRLVTCVVLLACWAIAVAQEPTVWVASPWEHVLRDSPRGQGTTARLQAAGNEYESFRVVVTAGAAHLADVDLQVSDLEGPAGRLPARQIALFREHYLHVTAPSEGSTAPPGWYPDALIPFVDPATGKPLKGAKYQAVPCRVGAGQNQGFWGDVHVPAGTAAGTYRGTVTVTAGGKTLGVVRLSLQVWPFALPETFAMRSNFGGLERVVTQAGLKAGSPEATRLLDRTIDLFLAHRCQPSGLGDIWPKWTPGKGMDDSQTGERLRHLVQDRHVNALALPFPWGDGPEKCRAYMHDLAAYLRQKGWLDLAYVYLSDEPNTAEEYELVRQQGKLLHEADPGIKRMCTEQTLTQDPAWGDLFGAVDIWCPLWGLWDEQTARQRQALGEEMWSYTALCQCDKRTPWWQVDFAPLVFRAPFWTSWHYGIDGFLYWSSVYWDEGKDPWDGPHFRDNYWGEGVLAYPGQAVGIEGVAPSIRLKLVREAMEDYEYLALAARLGKRTEADAIVAGVATSFQDWARNPRRYYQAREELAKLLSSPAR